MYNDILAFIRKEFNEPEKLIPLHEPTFSEKEKYFVIDAINSTYVSSVGKYVERFEEMVREYTGAKFATAIVNGTSALHLSLLLAGVKRDTLVITQALSFIATCNAISYLGADPIFIDIDLKTLGMSSDALEMFLNEKCELKSDGTYHKLTGKRISACVPMHTFGFPVEIDSIAEICTKYRIPLVEDAAESIGSKFKNQHTGTFGLLGTYSFNGNKTITCGGGGMIVTNDEKLGKMAKHLSTQAKIPHKWEFKHDNIGYNYRLPNLNAALACAQMEQLDHFISKKRKLAHSYKDFFSSTQYKFIVEPKNCFSNYWLNAILLNSIEERDSFLEVSNNKLVMTRPSWTLLNKLKMFNHCINDGLANSSYIEEHLVNIPSSVIKNI